MQFITQTWCHVIHSAKRDVAWRMSHLVLKLVSHFRCTLKPKKLFENWRHFPNSLGFFPAPCSTVIHAVFVVGIGYFTLPYLVHAGAAHVYACEWSPHAAEALHKNLRLNAVSDRCTVLYGDNRRASGALLFPGVYSYLGSPQRWERLEGVYSSLCETHCRTTEHHLPYGITQCYLPPDTGERTTP